MSPGQTKAWLIVQVQRSGCVICNRCHAARQSLLWMCGDYMQLPVCRFLFTLDDTHCISLGWKHALTLCCWQWSPWLHEAAGAPLQVWSRQSWCCELLHSETPHVASTQWLRVAHVILIWARCVPHLSSPSNKASSVQQYVQSCITQLSNTDLWCSKDRQYCMPTV